MLSIRDQLVREASALYGFVDSISAQCSRIPQSVAFTESSTRFFQHVDHLATATKEHLAVFPEDHIEAVTEEEFHETRAELCTIRNVWKELHQFIKPATDADTLNQPTALVAAMLGRAKLLPELQDADFAIFHTDSFDYLQVNPTSIRDLIRGLAFIVGAQEFPPGLALIGIPSTQGNALFLNCLLAHEVGEYAYSQKSLNNQLQPEVEAALHTVYGDEYEKLEKTERSYFVDTILGWGRELFCDLFAVYLIGPCYTCAYVELFDLPNLLSKSGAEITKTALPRIRFYKHHPSHPFRVKYQADLLKRLDWWPHLRGIDSRSVRVLEALMELKDEDFVEAEEVGRRPLIHAFFQIVPEISSQLGKLVGALDPGVHEFGQLRQYVGYYLREGIVPSTITVDDKSAQSRLVIPSSVTLLNCFTCFYLEQIDELMQRIEGQDLGSPQQRLYWTRKLEGWTSKALVDITLFNPL
jgi:hypothetical protein